MASRPGARGAAAQKEVKLDVNEYNAAVDAITAQAQQLGIDQSGAAAAEEDGFPPIPRLNIGGSEFQCRVEHLRSQPGSFLTAIFMGEEECEFDEQGRFFFDHDPTYVNLILNYMRTGECMIPYERGAFEAFRRDVQYFRLDTLEARCDMHYKKYIQPLLSGEKGSGAAAKRKGPNGMLCHAKYLSRQKEANGALVDKLCENVHNALLEGAQYGMMQLTLTSYRPPETIGVSGLPPFRFPDWASSDALFCWDPSFVGFFQPAHGFPALQGARHFLEHRLNEYGFKAHSTIDPEQGVTYEIQVTTGEE